MNLVNGSAHGPRCACGPSHSPTGTPAVLRNSARPGEGEPSVHHRGEAPTLTHGPPLRDPRVPQGGAHLRATSDPSGPGGDRAYRPALTAAGVASRSGGGPPQPSTTGRVPARNLWRIL